MQPHQYETKKGIKTYTCKNCGTTKTEVIKALGHDHQNEGQIEIRSYLHLRGSKLSLYKDAMIRRMLLELKH